MENVTRHHVTSRIVRLEAGAFAFVILLLWFDEAFDLPARLPGGGPTPFNWHEALVESLVIAVFGAAIVAVTRRLLARVQHLEGILPICAACKAIRDEQGRWHPVESYVRARTAADFTHGICPDCARRLYPDLVGDAPDDRPQA